VKVVFGKLCNVVFCFHVIYKVTKSLCFVLVNIAYILSVYKAPPPRVMTHLTEYFMAEILYSKSGFSVK